MVLIPVTSTPRPAQTSTSLPGGFEAVPETFDPSIQAPQPPPILDYTSSQAEAHLVCEDDYSSSDFSYTDYSSQADSRSNTPVRMNADSELCGIDVQVSDNVESPDTARQRQPDTSVHRDSSASRAVTSGSGQAVMPDASQQSLSGEDGSDLSLTQAAVYSTGGLSVENNPQDPTSSSSSNSMAVSLDASPVVAMTDVKEEREALTSEVRELRMTNTLMLCELGEAQAKEQAMEVSQHQSFHAFCWSQHQVCFDLILHSHVCCASVLGHGRWKFCVFQDLCTGGDPEVKFGYI